MNLVIFGVVVVALLVVATLFGTDSRDGNDWMEHSSMKERR
ncbi:hypothetical protein BH20ACT22_BH20ACT22_23370 [soil metagenome]